MNKWYIAGQLFSKGILTPLVIEMDEAIAYKRNLVIPESLYNPDRADLVIETMRVN